jgi:hypothetical protein
VKQRFRRRFKRCSNWRFIKKGARDSVETGAIDSVNKNVGD